MNQQGTITLEQSSYDRGACQIGIVHLGYGAFHRAHQAVYVDQMMQKTGDLRWGIAAVNLRAADSAGFEQAQRASQGYLLKTTSAEGSVRYQQIRAHVAFRDWAKGTDAAEALLNLPSVHVVSITVTESGYFLTEDGALDVENPVLAAEMSGGDAVSVYAYLANGLARRKQGCGLPITILCCDNIRSNGAMLRRNFLAYLTQRGLHDLADWVRTHAGFPCSMVDRITPRSSDTLLAEITAAFPGRALEPVHGESFTQWVLEDSFAGPMPDLTQAGVDVVPDVDVYEEAKIRILNGGHSALCYLGALSGLKTFDQVMRDPELRAHFFGWEHEDVLPGLTMDLPFDRVAYVDQIAQRFGNAAIADDLARICMDGWSKMQIFIRPTLSGCLKQGRTPTHGYNSIASWYVFARHVQAGTMPVGYTEPYWDTLEPLLAPGRATDFASNTQLWADLPTTYKDFVPGLVSAIERTLDQWPV